MSLEPFEKHFKSTLEEHPSDLDTSQLWESVQLAQKEQPKRRIWIWLLSGLSLLLLLWIALPQMQSLNPAHTDEHPEGQLHTDQTDAKPPNMIEEKQDEVQNDLANTAQADLGQDGQQKLKANKHNSPSEIINQDKQITNSRPNLASVPGSNTNAVFQSTLPIREELEVDPAQANNEESLKEPLHEVFTQGPLNLPKGGSLTTHESLITFNTKSYAVFDSIINPHSFIITPVPALDKLNPLLFQQRRSKSLPLVQLDLEAPNSTRPYYSNRNRKTTLLSFGGIVGNHTARYKSTDVQSEQYADWRNAVEKNIFTYGLYVDLHQMRKQWIFGTGIKVIQDVDLLTVKESFVEQGQSIGLTEILVDGNNQPLRQTLGQVDSITRKVYDFKIWRQSTQLQIPFYIGRRLLDKRFKLDLMMHADVGIFIKRKGAYIDGQYDFQSSSHEGQFLRPWTASLAGSLVFSYAVSPNMLIQVRPNYTQQLSASHVDSYGIQKSYGSYRIQLGLQYSF